MAAPEALKEFVIAYRVDAELAFGYLRIRQKGLDPRDEIFARAHVGANGGACLPQLQEETSPDLPRGSAWQNSPAMADETYLQGELRRRMKVLGLSAREVSLRASGGRNETLVKAILSGKSRNPRTDTLNAIARVLGCASDDLTGPNQPKLQTERVSDGQPSLWSTPVVEFDVNASAGGGTMIEHENAVGEWHFPTQWLRAEMRGSLRDLAVITVEGDSMLGTIQPGDKVIVDLGYKRPSPPGVYIVHDGVALVAKRLEYIEGSDPPSVRIISDNRHYEPYTRTVDEINIVGRVRGRWERL